MKKLTKRELELISFIGAVRVHEKGFYYYSVPASARRNGEMRVPHTTIDRLLKMGKIEKSGNALHPFTQPKH